ncbi:MAG: CBS domain-containing protein [Chloroflexota bacterium]|nr:CBS domain-containing protein [Chloroflexota bacterium]
MNLTARDIMVRDYDTIKPEAPIKEAVKLIFDGSVRVTGHKTVSAMVIDESGQLQGVITMFDILYHFRPQILNYGVDSINFWEGELESYIKQFEGLTVAQVMTSPVRYVAPDDHLMTIIDRMVKRKCRRLPVLENSKLIGVVYLSDVYYCLCKQWLKT